MRYTTIIDISEIDRVWRSQSTRLVYLYMVLRCGYHDNDRDVFKMSIRDMSCRLHLSVSAIRHALSVLQSVNLIRQVGTSQYLVTKWVETPSITKRKTKKQQEYDNQEAIRQQEAAKIERQRQQEHARIAALQSQGLTSFDLRLQRLKEKADAGDQEALKKYESLIKSQVKS